MPPLHQRDRSLQEDLVHPAKDTHQPSHHLASRRSRSHRVRSLAGQGLLSVGIALVTACVDVGDSATSDDSIPDDTASEDSGLPSLGELSTGTFTITQSWAQESDYARTVHVEVPDGSGPFPVLLLLHGNGGQGSGMLAAHRYLEGRILVAPDGYERSWNIAEEASKAPDIAFAAEILTHLGRHDNVDPNDVAILGISNGSALTQRLLIEHESPDFHHAVTIVSPLSALQYRDGSFYGDPDNDGTWDTAQNPPTGRRILNVSGDEDGLVPYEGGSGVLGYTFLPAEESAWRWATQMGFDGAQLASSAGIADASDENVVTYTYPDVGVSHIKVVGGGHNAGGVQAVQDQIAAFLAP
jgi:poly(3-hydroxybutyrate) depolymerase